MSAFNDINSTFNLPQNYSKNVTGYGDFASLTEDLNVGVGVTNTATENGWFFIKTNRYNKSNSKVIVTLGKNSYNYWLDDKIAANSFVIPALKGTTVKVTESDVAGTGNFFIPSKPVNNFNLIIKY